MSNIVRPIHTAAVGLANVNFFRSPLPGPQQPWFAWEDLLLACALPRDIRRGLASDLLTVHRGQVARVMTSNGPTTIAPHYMGQGFIGAMEELGRAPAGFLMAYTLGIAAAMTIICNDLGLSEREAMSYSVAAFRNSNGITDGTGEVRP
jgi:hypothetical protein